MFNFLNKKTIKSHIPIIAGIGKSTDLQYFSDTNYLSFYRNIPPLQAIINYISNNTAIGKWKLEENGDLKEKAKVLKILETPHPLYTEHEFKSLVCKQLLLFGFVVIHKTTNLYILPSWLTTIKTKQNLDIKSISEAKNLNEIVSEISVNYTFSEKKFNISECKIISLDNLSEIDYQNNILRFESPLDALENISETVLYIYETMKYLNKHRGAIGILSDNTKSSVDGFSMNILNESEKENIQKEYQKYGTIGKKYQMLITNARVKYQQISLPIKDMNLTEQLNILKKTIADIYNFDTILLNDADAQKYANYKIARMSFFQENISPKADLISNAISDLFFLEKSNLKLKLDYSHLDIFKEDEKLRSDIQAQDAQTLINLRTAQQNNILTEEDINRILQL